MPPLDTVPAVASGVASRLASGLGGSVWALGNCPSPMDYQGVTKSGVDEDLMP